jgi:hypothetical protein
MDVKDFVAETLKQVIDGIKEAQEYAKINGATIEPEQYEHSRQMGEDRPPPTPLGKAKEKEMTFDIAVTAQESAGKEGKGGLKIPYVSVGGSLSSEQLNASVSRVRFSVDVRLPCQKKG